MLSLVGGKQSLVTRQAYNGLREILEAILKTAISTAVR